MEQALDTLAASRKLGESGMPGRQADAVVEVVNDAMKNLVTKEFLTAELDRRFGDLDKRLSAEFAAVGKRFAAVDERFAGVDKQFAGVDKQFAGVDKQFAGVDKRFAAVDERFAAVDKRFTRLESNMEVGFSSVREVMHSSQKTLIAIMMASTLTVIAMQITVLAILL